MKRLWGFFFSSNMWSRFVGFSDSAQWYEEWFLEGKEIQKSPALVQVPLA